MITFLEQVRWSLVILIASSIATTCPAQPSFKQVGATAPLASNTHDFVAVFDGSPLSGDFNNDGFQDFILSGTADNGYVIENKLYLNDGEGSFYSVNQDQITAYTRPMSVAGDIDNDGDLDYIHNGYLATQFIYLNDGLGNFSVAPNGDLTAYDNGAMDLADFDADGDLDLICTGRNAGLLSQTDWYANDGNGLFTLMTSNLEDLRTSHVLAEDIDNDGDFDIVLNGMNTASLARTLVYLNNGTGVFSLLANPALIQSYWGDLALGDVDGDDDLDLFLTGRDDDGDEYSLLYLNNGSGVFAASGQVFTETFEGSPVFFDLEGDGDLDVILNGRVGNGLSRISKIYVNNGGTFTESANDFIQTSASNPVVTDVENDGDMDILLTGEISIGDAAARLYLNDAAGNFEEVLNSPFGTFAQGGLDYGDVDGDGDLDVMIAGRNWGTVELYTELYLNDGFGHFMDEIANDFVPRSNGEVHLIDVDGDGDLDASVSGIDMDDEISTDIYLNNGTGAFNLSTTIAGTNSGSSDWADVDNDGDLDYLISGLIAPNIGLTELFIQNTGGTFSQSSNNFPNLYYGDCEFFDFDNDGDPDLVITGQPNISTCVTYLYENNGSGVFTSVIGLPSTGYSIGSLTTGDFNNDGLLDVAFSGQVCGGLYPFNCDVFLQNPSNQFDLHVSLPGRLAGDLEAGDLDLDGDLDLILSGEGFNSEGDDYSVVFLENDGAANFEPYILEELFAHVDTEIGLFDGDADGDLDLAISSWSLKDYPRNKSYYYESTINDCEPTFATAQHTACESFTWMDGNTYTESNNSATYVMTNAAGCDSLVTLNLTITQPTVGIDTQSSCESFTWVDGNTYSESNSTATYVMTNAAGCDSLVTLNLTITQPTFGIDTQSSCESFIWIDGNTYSESNNTATYVLTNAAGCDSLVTLNLTITQPTFGIDTQSSCESFTWIDGNTYSESNNSATYVLTNIAGCDSIVTLNLSITQPTSGIDTQSSCESFTWIDGNTYSESNNSATYVLTNIAGCDSVVTLNLTIPQVDSGTNLSDNTLTANASGASYQWIDCDNNNTPIEGETNQSFTPEISGNYAVIVGQNGCEETSDCVDLTIISVDEISANDIVIFPNPSRGIFRIQTLEIVKNVRVYDALGREFDVEYLAGSNQLDCGKVASGNYIVELIFEHTTIRRAVTIE